MGGKINCKQNGNAIITGFVSKNAHRENSHKAYLAFSFYQINGKLKVIDIGIVILQPGEINAK